MNEMIPIPQNPADVMTGILKVCCKEGIKHLPEILKAGVQIAARKEIAEAEVSRMFYPILKDNTTTFVNRLSETFHIYAQSNIKDFDLIINTITNYPEASLDEKVRYALEAEKVKNEISRENISTYTNCLTTVVNKVTIGACSWVFVNKVLPDILRTMRCQARCSVSKKVIEGMGKCVEVIIDGIVLIFVPRKPFWA